MGSVSPEKVSKTVKSALLSLFRRADFSFMILFRALGEISAKDWGGTLRGSCVQISKIGFFNRLKALTVVRAF